MTADGVRLMAAFLARSLERGLGVVRGSVEVDVDVVVGLGICASCSVRLTFSCGSSSTRIFFCDISGGRISFNWGV